MTPYHFLITGLILINSQPAIQGANANEEASLITWPGPTGPNMTYIHEESLSVHICPAVHHTR